MAIDRYSELKNIYEFIDNKFRQARINLTSVHDFHLRKWATEAITNSSTAQKDQELYKQNLPKIKQVVIRTIPPKTTSFVKPLDVYFFR